jgi:hypothetical protein
MQTHYRLLFAGAAMALVMSACVTINIYFPEAAAEKAADKIIEDVWQLEGAGRNEPATDDATPAQGQE